MLRFLIFILGFFLVSESTAQKPKTFDSEIIEQEIEFRQNKDSTLTTLYDKKGIVLEGVYKIIQNDSTVHYTMIREGLWDGTYKTGELNSEETYEMGIKKDMGTWYYKNGNKKRVILYKNRDKHGPCIWYYRNGQPLEECTYQEGKEEGVCKWYFAKGNLKWLVTHERGITNGNVQKYKSDGTQEFNGYFLNDVQVNKTVFEKSQRKQ